MKILRTVLSVISAAAFTACLGSMISTLRVTAALESIGAPITLSENFDMVVYDIIHFAPLYGLFTVFAFLIAFSAAYIVAKKTRLHRYAVFATAGAIAMLVMLYLMQKVFFGQPIVAGARDNLGLIYQAVAGALGASLFAYVNDPQRRASRKMTAPS